MKDAQIAQCQCDLFPQVDGGSTPTSALHLLVKDIEVSAAMDCFRRWHYLGDSNIFATKCYGIYAGLWLVGALAFGPPHATELRGYYERNTQDGWWEIVRFALRDDLPKNSESRTLSIGIRLLRKSRKVVGIVTRADSGQGHTGAIYKAIGFTYLGLSAPKTDAVVNGKIRHRGVKKGDLVTWIPRSRKHVFVKTFCNDRTHTD